MEKKSRCGTWESGYDVVHDRCTLYKSPYGWMRSGRKESRDRAYKKRLNTKVPLAIDKRGEPVRILLSAGQKADYAYAMRLTERVPIRILLVDREYDVN
jgi:hypothetical protein